MNETVKKLNKVRKFILARALNVVTGMCKIYAPETLEDWKAIRDNLKQKVGLPSNRIPDFKHVPKPPKK